MTHDPVSRIVVGVDGSAASAAAVRWAVREARLRHAAIHLVHAYHSDSRLHAPYASSSWLARQDERYAAAKETLTAAEELAIRHLPPGRLTSELVNEPPARALLDRAIDAEMLVLGTTRPTLPPGQPPGAMGPVARACLRLAHCPVVVVAPDDHLPRHTPPGRQERQAPRQRTPHPADQACPPAEHAASMLEPATR
jgi:nucleotide-binding universal stress UspA family protein